MVDSLNLQHTINLPSDIFSRGKIAHASGGTLFAANYIKALKCTARAHRSIMGIRRNPLSCNYVITAKECGALEQSCASTSIFIICEFCKEHYMMSRLSRSGSRAIELKVKKYGKSPTQVVQRPMDDGQRT